MIGSHGEKAPVEVNFRGLAPDGEVIEGLRQHMPNNVHVSFGEKSILITGHVDLVSPDVSNESLLFIHR